LSPISNALESKAKCPTCNSSKVPPVATRSNLRLIVADPHTDKLGIPLEYLYR
jgi:hypothetical protein